MINVCGFFGWIEWKSDYGERWTYFQNTEQKYKNIFTYTEFNYLYLCFITLFWNLYVGNITLQDCSYMQHARNTKKK